MRLSWRRDPRGLPYIRKSLLSRSIQNGDTIGSVKYLRGVSSLWCYCVLFLLFYIAFAAAVLTRKALYLFVFCFPFDKFGFYTRHLALIVKNILRDNLYIVGQSVKAPFKISGVLNKEVK